MSRICVNCGNPSNVIDSRAKGDLTKRRRRCSFCKNAWTTYELREEYIDEDKLQIALETYMEELDE